MAQTRPLTQSEVQELVYTWFQKITDKAPVKEMVAMLATNGLEMVFPERTLRSHDDFADWYAGDQGVTYKFFDQVHDLKMIAVDLAGDTAAVTLVVNWQARTWTPPDPYSEWQGAYVHQSWTIKRNASSDAPVIVTYRVGAFEPMRAS